MVETCQSAKYSCCPFPTRHSGHLSRTHKHLPTMLNFHFYTTSHTLPLASVVPAVLLFISNFKAKEKEQKWRNVCWEKCTDPLSISLFDNLTPCIMQRYLATIQKETYCRHTVHAIPFQTHKCPSKSLIQMLTSGVFPLLKKEKMANCFLWANHLKHTP